MNRCRELSVNAVVARCKNCQTIPGIKKALAPLVRGGCPHFCIVGGNKQWHLLYAGVSQRMNLDLIIEKMELFRHYKDGTVTIEDNGLDTWHVLALTGFGYGATVALDLVDDAIEVLVLSREDDSSYGIARKDIYTIASVNRA